MGSQKDIMTTFAERDLRQRFSPFDGWNIAPVNGVQTTACLYRASRNRIYHEEIAFISVSFEQEPLDEAIAALESLPSTRGSRVKKYLLTPQAADTGAVPPHVSVIPMSVFAFVDGNLVWLTKKKNARQYITEPAPKPSRETLTRPACSS